MHLMNTGSFPLISPFLNVFKKLVSRELAPLFEFDEQSDRGALRAIDFNLGKRGDANDLHSRRREKAARDRHGFHALIKSGCAHRLQLDGALLAHDAGDGTSDRIGFAFGRNSQHLHDG